MYDSINVNYKCPKCRAELKDFLISDGVYNSMYKSPSHKKYELGDQIYYNGRWIYVSTLKLADTCSKCDKEIKGEMCINKGVISKIILTNENKKLETIAEINLDRVPSDPHKNRPWK